MLPAFTLKFDNSHDYVIGISEDGTFPIRVYVEHDMEDNGRTLWALVKVIESDEGSMIL